MAYQIVKSADMEYAIREVCHHDACITCGERHGDDIPCKDTDWKRYWQRLGEQVVALLSRNTDA